MSDMSHESQLSKDAHNKSEDVATGEEVDLQSVLSPVFFPDEQTVVTGALSPEQIAHIAASGVEHVINFQPESELTFDEKSAVEAHGMSYSHLPITGAEDLKQVNLLEFDKILRQHHGQRILMHCSTGNRVGACVALRQGWLRGRKMDTAMKRGKEHGLSSASLEEEVYKRLLVPR
ncbi:beta-lactamase hydrolase domain-containing protein [Psychrobacter sp. I-STPA6b]|uniref:beta-lactamase hydrolase domain-containing protein n=1 Tax=Psychrobacter sp. I-STPA6b TaxID=2585718 RepID=UPI0029CABCC6|nr:sulfur transferase domain-containing protein [Psychrobacter sp. I-STPA6b]